MFFNNKFNTFFGLNLTLVYTFPMCMAWRFHFPIRNYDFKVKGKLEEHGREDIRRISQCGAVMFGNTAELGGQGFQ